MTLHFQTFSIDPDGRTLHVQGQEVVIGSRAFDVLLALAERYGQVVPKQTLLTLVWPGLVVEENNLQVQMATLRRVLGKAVITTISGRGYCLTEHLRPPTAQDQTAPTQGAGVQVANEEGVLNQTLAPQGRLPSFIPRLYGREHDVFQISQLLQTHRLLTLTGAGGVGKTHLANGLGLALQERWPDGAWLLRAEGCRDLGDLIVAALQCLGVVASRDINPSRASEQVAMNELCKVLERKQLLLIVDNCEHLQAAAQTLLSMLLERVPGLQVLATSQVPLQLPSECVYLVGTLSLPTQEHTPEQVLQCGAMQLLLGRLQQLHQRFTDLSPEELGYAKTICQKLDGMALALVLAAARVPLLGLRAVSEHLSDGLNLLVTHKPTGQMPARHATLRAVIDWTYRLLEPDQAQAFCRLSLLVGSFDLGTARHVLGGSDMPQWQVLKQLEGLLHHGLLMVADDGDERYRLLQPHRLYALERMTQEQVLSEEQRHFARALLVRSDELIQARQTQTLWAELPHINAAFEWACEQSDAACHELAVALAVNTAMLLLVGSRAGQALHNLQRVAQWVDGHSSRWRVAKYWQWLGRCGVHGRLPTSQCIAAFDRAQSLYAQLGKTRHVHACKRMLAESYMGSGDLPRAQQALHEAQHMEDHQTPVADSMRRLRVQALLAHKQGHLPQALEMLRQALTMAQLAHIERYVLTIELDMARLYIEMGQMHESLEIFHRLKHTGRRYFFHQLTVGTACADWALALLKLGEWARAAEVCLFALPYWERSGIFARHGDLLAWWLAGTGHAQAALAMLALADRFFADQEIQRDALAAQIQQEAKRWVQLQLPQHDAAVLSHAVGHGTMPPEQLARYLETQVQAYLQAAAAG